MAFTFFTLGGRQLWEDVFFSQKWRIQRNCITKRYRLLDNWDIRRAVGSFEDCHHAFVRCSKIFQLSSSRERAVIMLHGLGGNKNQFNQMAKMVESIMAVPIAINYPSTRKDMDAHLRQIDFLLNNLEGIKEISFISDGIGGLLVKKLLSADSLWQKKIKIGRIVQINPPNRGYRLWERLADSKIATAILGPMIKFGDSHRAAKISRFPEKIEFAIINTHNRIGSLIRRMLPKSWEQLLPQTGDSFLPGAKDIKDIKIWRINSAADQRTIRCCKSFLQNGKF